jgi:hypothetical protein
MTTSMKIPEDGTTAASAMRALLSHPHIATRVDERLFEALLAHTLNHVPGLASTLLGCDENLRFKLGGRRKPDVVGLLEAPYTTGIEVKLRSNHNWQRGPKRWQLDVYSDFAPQARLFLLLPDERVEAFTSELVTELVESRFRWTILTLSMLRTALERATGDVAPDDNAAARLMLALGRLS